MIPDFTSEGVLPAGVHTATWREICDRFGSNEHRKRLLSGLLEALTSLKAAGCKTVYLDGSFVTSKDRPGDFDACWDPSGVNPRLLDPVLLVFDAGRVTQKAKYGGELFVSVMQNGNPGSAILEFFQKDKMTGKNKGIVAIDLGRLP